MILKTHKQKAEIAEKILNSKGPISVEVIEDIRSIQSNARYWAAIVTSIQDTFSRQDLKYSKEAIHEFLKQERYGKKVDVINGKIVERSARSRKMTPKQFTKFVEWAEIYAIDVLDVDPGEIDGQHWQQ